MSLMNDLLKLNKKNKNVTILDESEFFAKNIVAHTKCPMYNVALSGELDGGLTPGITMMVGESKTFKTGMSLYAVLSYLEEHSDAICIYMVSEFGANKDFFDSMGIDASRVIMHPITTIEQLKIDMSQYLKVLEEKKQAGEDVHVIFFVDSIAQLASLKEMNDAEEGNVIVDMTRAKALNSLFRIITPKIALLQVPCILINSFYSDQGNKYADPIISGGKKSTLCPDTIWFISRRQAKDDKELIGFDFVINILKGRMVKEKAKIPISVRFDGGIDIYSGLLEVAVAGGYVVSPTKGYYSLSEDFFPSLSADKWRRKALNVEEFWKPVLQDESFQKFVSNMYAINTGSIVNPEAQKIMESFDSETGEV